MAAGLGLADEGPHWTVCGRCGVALAVDGDGHGAVDDIVRPHSDVDVGAVRHYGVVVRPVVPLIDQFDAAHRQCRIDGDGLGDDAAVTSVSGAVGDGGSIRTDIAVKIAIGQHIVGVPLCGQLQLRIDFDIGGASRLVLHGVNVLDDTLVEPRIIGIGARCDGNRAAHQRDGGRALTTHCDGSHGTPLFGLAARQDVVVTVSTYSKFGDSRKSRFFS